MPRSSRRRRMTESTGVDKRHWHCGICQFITEHVFVSERPGVREWECARCGCMNIQPLFAEIPEEVMERAVKTVLFPACWMCGHWGHETFDDLNCKSKDSCVRKARKAVEQVRLILAGESRDLGICPKCHNVAPYEFDSVTGMVITHICPRCGIVSTNMAEVAVEGAGG